MAILDSREVIARLMVLERETAALQFKIQSLAVLLREGLDSQDSVV